MFGAGEGVDGVFVDRYGPGVVLAIHESAGLPRAVAPALASALLEDVRPQGVTSVYFKSFVRDRSREVESIGEGASPIAGEALPHAFLVREYDCRFEVRLGDGWSTGLFLDQRENRRALGRLVAERRAAAAGNEARVLNLFAYTCAFAVPLLAAGAHVTNVDVSPRALDWGRRNVAANALDATRATFVRMDAMAYLAFARRRGLTFDLVILDPPTFGAASKRRGVRAWSATRDYAALVQAAALVVAPGGLTFASTNASALCSDGVLERLIERAIGRPPAYVALPRPPTDFARERGRLVARLFR